MTEIVPGVNAELWQRQRIEERPGHVSAQCLRHNSIRISFSTESSGFTESKILGATNEALTLASQRLPFGLSCAACWTELRGVWSVAWMNVLVLALPSQPMMAARCIFFLFLSLFKT